MTKYLWIPVAGTVAALIAIALAHGPREGEGAAPALPRLEELLPPEAPEHALALAADGSFTEGEHTFASAEEVIAELATEEGPRPTIILRKASDEVTDEALEAAEEALAGRFDVRREPPG